MRNIANVVHDLEQVVINNRLQVEMLVNNSLSEETRGKLFDSLMYGAELLDIYIAELKAEALRNGLEKVANPL